MSEVVVTLKHPIDVAGETVTRVTVRRPLVKHLKAMDAVEGEVAKLAALLAGLSGLPPAAVDQMDAGDFTACTAPLVGFFGKPPATGGT